jgi:nucleosome binding factor SPN SPT16 subunit
VAKTEESDHLVLRINFQSPGQIAGKKEDMPFEDPDATFIRSASFRSPDQRHMLKVYDTITGLKKAATKREAERKEMADVVEQEKLIEIRGERGDSRCGRCSLTECRSTTTYPEECLSQTRAGREED